MNTKSKRIYIDSSVVYGAPTKEFSQDSKRFWEAFRNGEFTLIVSDVLRIEMERASAHIRNLYQALPESQIERITLAEESKELAEQYIIGQVIGESNRDDSRHIALATIAGADAIVSWNFKHMIYRRAGYNDVNEKLGYPCLAILAPSKFLEVHHDEK